VTNSADHVGGLTGCEKAKYDIIGCFYINTVVGDDDNYDIIII